MMQTTVETEAGKQHEVEWEPVPLAVALGPEWTWHAVENDSGRRDVKHPSGLWVRLLLDHAFSEDEVEVTLIAGAMACGVEAGATGNVSISLGTDGLGDGTCLRSGWVQQGRHPCGRIFSLLVLDPAGVTDWTDEDLLARHALLMTEAEELRRTDTEPSKVSVGLAARLESALEARDYAWDEEASGWARLVPHVGLIEPYRSAMTRLVLDGVSAEDAAQARAALQEMKGGDARIEVLDEDDDLGPG